MKHKQFSWITEQQKEGDSELFPLFPPFSLSLFHHIVSTSPLLSSCVIFFAFISYFPFLNPPSLSFPYPVLPLCFSSSLSPATALSDGRHRLGDESLRLSSVYLMWFRPGPWSCCSFSSGSSIHTDLPFISSRCGCVFEGEI